MQMPVLATERLSIRPLTLKDLDDVHHLLDVELTDADTGTQGAATREQRRDWLQWTVLGYAQLAWLYQPPYGERAIILEDSGALVGLVGLVPCLGPHGQLASLKAVGAPARPSLNTAEVGLYWSLRPAHRGQGYATEATRALIRFAFEHLHLQRLIAATTHDNAASQAVMRRLGMRLERNPLPTPPWLQTVGVLENPAAAPAP
jgi:[ribosomal protein S5]-alanine N-acetyltransferase